MKYIYTHLGLGDHVICNGLVRSLVKSNEQYCLFVKPQNVQTVSFMYKDLPNISFYEADDAEVRTFIRRNKINREDLILAGPITHANTVPMRLLNMLQRGCPSLFVSRTRVADPCDSCHSSFDELFYSEHNIPFSHRWDKFYVERDFKAETDLFTQFGVKENEYVFVHDDHARGFHIDDSFFINKHLPIVRPVVGLTQNAFDYCYLMEQSRESHFIDSSFRLIFDSLKLRQTNIYFHIHLLHGVVKDPSTYSRSFLNFVII
jgi:hypothetical protein